MDVMGFKYEMTTHRLGVGMLFRFVVSSIPVNLLYSDLIRMIEYWCVDNIGDPADYDIIETRMGCQVTIYDDIHATAFRLTWM